MRSMILGLTLVAGCAPSASAYCTTSGQPGIVTLASHVMLIQDDTAYKAGTDLWVLGGTKADAQLFAWLVWSDWPTGQGCVVTMIARRNDTCGGRVDVQFEQRTAYNVGFSASDTGTSTTAYPYRCSLEVVFHIYDTHGIPNPRYNPNDPFNTEPPYIPDPGFDFWSVVQLDVTGERMATPGGVPSVPDGVTRNGECPTAQPDDEFPAFMLTGPGCGGNSIRTNSASTGAAVSAPAMTWQTMTAAASKTASGQSVQDLQAQSAVQRSSATGRNALRAAGQPRQSAAMQAASRARLTAMLDKVAASTVRQGGRPMLKAKAQ